MKIYTDRKAQFSKALEKINARHGNVSLLRLVTISAMLFSLFFLIKTQENLYGFAAFVLFAFFLWLMRIHSGLSREKELHLALIKINADESDYLSDKSVPFENGSEYQQFSHPYAYDLDIFAADSLFQHLNRTATFIGKDTLARQLLSLLPPDEILRNQQAVRELSGKLEWRQDFAALGKTSHDSRQQYETLLKWSKAAGSPVSRQITMIAFAAPVFFTGAAIAYFVTGNLDFTKLISFLFVFNLGLFGQFFKRVKAEVQHAENLDKSISKYGLILRNIENEAFESPKLKALQQKLYHENTAASAHLKKLSELFSRMDSAGNFVTTLLFNGTFLFHIHVLKAMLSWKRENAPALAGWLDTIGEFEMLCSLANLAYNNPDFAFAELNDKHRISFENLSHPLLNRETRVGNDVEFQPQSFMILTGSNMSGKSTFLRSLGINMVLAGIGAPVCATKADIHPLPVLVSMRLSDSLSDSESYFFAEIRRLRQIMETLGQNRAFVLLDEILRGTNSDDKRSGTIGVVKKMIAHKAIGAIATHDIEVCLTTDDYPQQLANKCFEVEIIRDELHFDYKLRDGICRNKSATFLMKKMEII